MFGLFPWNSKTAIADFGKQSIPALNSEAGNSTSCFRDPVWWLAVTIVVAIGVLRITACYDVFWQTWDEGVTVATGLELLERGTYTVERLHPPLARVLSALLPYLTGAKSADAVLIWDRGNAVLASPLGYEQTLRLARLGILPCFVVSTVLVSWWSYRCGGRAMAVMSLLLYTTLPSILGHSGLATLDMACATLTSAAMIIAWQWSNRATIARSLLLGSVSGMAILTKFSAIGFLVVYAALIALSRFPPWLPRRQRTATNSGPNRWYGTHSLVVVLSIAAVIWAGYGFSVDSVANVIRTCKQSDNQAPQAEPSGWSNLILEHLYIPAPEFTVGLVEIRERNRLGHPNCFLGTTRSEGWWYFYPVALFFKTPIAFQVLSAIGLGHLFRREGKIPEEVPVMASVLGLVAVLQVGMLSGISNGTRQLLTVYPLATILSASGASRLWNSTRCSRIWRLVVCGLIIWQCTTSALAHPDYIAYFNEFAGNRPNEISVDSDLDWGQDLKRLVGVLKERQIEEVSIAYYGSADLEQFDLPPWRKLEPGVPSTGWIAISIGCLKLGVKIPPYDDYAWLEQHTPVRIVGKSIALYQIPQKSPP